MHYGKRKIVAIATFVTRAKVIASDRYYRAIGEIGKGPGDRCGRGIADDDEGGSYAKSDTGFSANGQSCAAGDGDAVRDDFVSLGVVAGGLERIEICPAGLKCKAALDGECRLISRVRSWVQRSGTAASADRDAAADGTGAAECAASHLHGAAAGGAPGAVRADEGAAADRRGAGISARAEERDDAAFISTLSKSEMLPL